MSAIFGTLRFDKKEALRGDLERMSNTLVHRGPDGRKFLIEGIAGLGQCLMRVNHEDRFEVQPLHDREAGLILVSDCRIDNRDELAQAFEISAAELERLPDSALVLQAYKRWGEDCAAHLLGDFAFAIWDSRAGTLVLGRDHMGQRQVHYHRGENFFVFATEIEALWAHRDVPSVLTDTQIARMLLGAPSRKEGQTQFDSIFGLPGATVLCVRPDGSMATRRYWEPQADPVHEGRDEAYYIEAYRRVLGEATACRLRRTIGPPGIVFSGGYDSTAIAGLAGPGLAGSGRKLVTAASVMPAGYRGSVRHARRWVEMCARDMAHLDVCYVTTEGQDFLAELERGLVGPGRPEAPHGVIQKALFSTLSRKGVRLAVDGHGGDYTLNPRGQAALARLLVQFRPLRFLSELRGHLRMSGHGSWTTLKRDLVALLLPRVQMLWKRIRRGGAPVWSARPINRKFAEQVLASEIGEDLSQPFRIARTDMRKRMAAVLWRVTTRSATGQADLAARQGLDLSRPFHDKRVVELALAIPEDLYVKNGRNRYLACQALKDIYPREFQMRWRRNDDSLPDFQRLMKAIEPQLLKEAARLEAVESLSRFVDFAKIRALLAQRGPADHNSGWEEETHLAVNGLHAARYVEWIRRSNR